jgi:hypothetical protein
MRMFEELNWSPEEIEMILHRGELKADLGLELSQIEAGMMNWRHRVYLEQLREADRQAPKHYD